MNGFSPEAMSGYYRIPMAAGECINFGEERKRAPTQTDDRVRGRPISGHDEHHHLNDPAINRTVWQPPILVAVVTATALAMRLAFLGAKSFDLDEAVSISYARLGWVSFRRAVASDVNMGLYYGLLKVWRHLGESEASLRALSVILAVATVPAVYALGRHLFSHRVGLIAALLLAVNPSHIRYAQQARGYSLVVLLVVLSCVFFVQALERPSRRDVAGYLTASVLAVYSHVFAGLVLLAQWISLVIPRPTRVPMNALRMSAAMVALLALPLAVLGARRRQLSWIPPIGVQIRDFFANGGGRPQRLSSSPLSLPASPPSSASAWCGAPVRARGRRGGTPCCCRGWGCPFSRRCWCRPSRQCFPPAT